MHQRMHAVKTLLFLSFANSIMANATTDAAAGRAQQEAVADCQLPTSSFESSDGTTTTFSQFPDPLCWDTLKMDDWMTNWNATTTVCNATTATAKSSCQCQFDEPWATCFMRLTFHGNKTASYGCSNLMRSDNCTQPLPGNVVQGPAEIFYGAYSVCQPSFNSDTD